MRCLAQAHVLQVPNRLAATSDASWITAEHARPRPGSHSASRRSSCRKLFKTQASGKSRRGLRQKRVSRKHPKVVARRKGPGSADWPVCLKDTRTGALESHGNSTRPGVLLGLPTGPFKAFCGKLCWCHSASRSPLHLLLLASVGCSLGCLQVQSTTSHAWQRC